MLPPGEYRYEVTKGGRLVATEEAHLTPQGLTAVRKAASGAERYEVQATLGPDGLVESVEARYVRGPFSRSASYRADGELFRGSVTALAARNSAEAKLGRFREVDAGLVLFKALVIAHLRSRGQAKFVGRVVTIDPDTLVVSSPKQTYRPVDAEARHWVFEPSMSESEKLEIDGEGRVLHLVDARGNETVLKSFAPLQ